MSTMRKAISPTNALGVVFSKHLRQQVSARKTFILGAVLLVPVIGAVVYAAGDGTSGLSVFKSLVESIYIALLLPLAGLFFGGPTVVEEIEGQTASYLFLRPVAKPLVFLGKVLASILMVSAMVLVPVLLLYPILMTAGASVGDHLPMLAKMSMTLLIGSVSYTAVFAALGALFSRSLLAGIIFWVVFEWLLSLVPVLGTATQKYHLRNTADLIDPGQLGTLEKFVGLQKPIIVSIPLSYAVLIGVTCVALAVGAYVFNRRQYMA